MCNDMDGSQNTYSQWKEANTQKLYTAWTQLFALLEQKK